VTTLQATASSRWRDPWALRGVHFAARSIAGGVLAAALLISLAVARVLMPGAATVFSVYEQGQHAVRPA
jgi:hypothetical protein